jgi:hypothetical protein
MKARGVDGLREGHPRQHAGKAARPHRLRHPGAEHQQVAQFIAVCSGGKSVVSIFQITFKSS